LNAILTLEKHMIDAKDQKRIYEQCGMSASSRRIPMSKDKLRFEMLSQLLRDRLKYLQPVQAMFEQADTDGDGVISET
jgi:hypothetical protein